MAIERATVETLTAEVRVLMVGSRQITLSVARQLDRVGLYDLEPFGRIRLASHRWTFIGRCVRTGALVLTHDYYGHELTEEYRNLPLIVLAGLK